ncbi:MAG: Asp-tRNA(Asn)/Glu-tRNA(Gln) amidotransferase subunit GatA [Candidatus Riflebacteria bacterium]|nr:Asp-tRNA(Asn)/Glu-tRNA(Gln) amidotransferase subunit GatA [Candidatus Riflebacteria bacterium]
MEPFELTAARLAQELRARRISSHELVEHLFARMERLDPYLHSFLCRTRPLALQLADEADQRLAAGAASGPLEGVPVALKDNISVAGFPATCGSRILEPYRPVFDAHVVERLKEHRLPILGKTNMDEFAMGSSTENSAFGPVANPWDLSRVPGGSSGGSAAAVAARLTPLALGSDTGGSIRQPASFCGIVGLKPTYGAVSRYGLVAFASSLDQIGPLARTVEDCALLYSVLAGKDPRDSTSVGASVPDLGRSLDRPIKGLKVGIVREMVGEGIGPETREAIRRAARVLEELGAIVGEATLPHMHHAIPTYYIIACAEASSNLARYDGVRYGRRAAGGDLISVFEKTRAEGFGPEVKRRIMLGTFVLSSGYHDAYYSRAQKVRTLIKRDFQKALEEHDLLIGATSPTPAFRRGERCDDPLQMYAADVCTVSVNLAGGPGLVVPCGLSPDRLPIGLQILGRPFDEERMLNLGHAFQQATNHHLEVPSLASPEGEPEGVWGAK